MLYILLNFIGKPDVDSLSAVSDAFPVLMVKQQLGYCIELFR